MNLTKTGQVGSMALIHCWPFEEKGPLPSLLDDPEYIGRAFFEHLPAFRNWPASAVRRGLKQAAKRLGISFGRSNIGDQRTRDNDLAYEFAARAVGRGALRSIEIVFETQRQSSRRGRHVKDDLDASLPEILWTQFSKSSEHSELGDWAATVGIPRPDLGKKDAFYLTADVLDDCLSSNPPPRPIDHIDLARLVLLFSAILPRAEGLALVRVAAARGMNALEIPESIVSTGVVGAVKTVEHLELQQDIGGETFPVLTAPPALAVIPAAIPLPTVQAQQISSEIQGAYEASVIGERLADTDLTVGDLLKLDHAAYLSQLDAIGSARSLREALTGATKRGQTYASDAISSAVTSINLSEPNWLAGLTAVAPFDLANAVVQADALLQLAQFNISEDVARHWLPEAEAATNLPLLIEAFRQLPSRCDYAKLLATRERDYVADVRQFISRFSPSASDIGMWLRRLSSAEIRALLDNLEEGEWSLFASFLIRLGIDSSPEGGIECATRLTKIENRKSRRDLLHFVDPTSVALDEAPDLQRVIVAERLRDTLSDAPLVAITDPSLRLTDVGLVGGPLASLFELLIHHLDLIGNSVELHRLASAEGLASASSGSIELDLVNYTTTTTASSGLYLQLREAVRELYFLPLVNLGELDHDAVVELAGAFDVDDAIESAVAQVRRDNHRLARIEPRHRARVQRYVRHGKELLESYVHSKATRSHTRRRDFRGELSRALNQLNSEPAPIGSNPWLEGEVRGMLLQPSSSEFATLLGGPLPIPERPWSAADTGWALQSIKLSEFFVDTRISTLDIAAKAVRAWGQNIKPDAEQIVSELLVKSQFLAARAFVEEEGGSGPQLDVLNHRIVGAANDVGQPIRDRVQALYDAHSQDLVQTFTTHSELLSSLEGWRFTEAAEQLDFLEMEVSERIEADHKDTLDASQAGERNALVRRLLQAGVEGPDERWSLADLESRWAAEYASRSGMRAHLRPIEKALAASETLPELAADAREFARQCADPSNWLPVPRADELLSLVEGPADKLRTWLQLAEQLTPPAQRPALLEVVRFLLRLVHETATALRTLDEGANSDHLLESALEVEYVFEQSVDPIACAQGLDLAVEKAEEHQVPAPVQAQDESQVRETLAVLAEGGEWLALAEAARAFRLSANDEEARRLADVAEFADAMRALEDGRVASARDGLVTSARVLGASGHFISRALPPRRQQAIAFDLLAAALGATDVDIKSMSPQPDGSWLKLVDKRWGLLQAFGEGGLPARVLEQLCSGTFGREVVTRIWDAPKSTAEPGPLRAAFLKFLHERGLDEHLLFLAARYEPNLHSRLGQLMNLRKIVSQRPDLVPVSEAVANQVARAAQGVPFRTFVQDLPTAAQSVDADLVVNVDNDIVLRVDRRKPAELSVAISISPRGLVPESLEAILFADDDVAFDDNTRRRMLSMAPVYFPTEYNVGVRFGESWNDAGIRADVSFRIRINARVLAGELISRDVVCQLTRTELHSGDLRRIDDETLLDTFPGVENTPAAGDSFIGRVEELERLHGALVSARRPSPVLLTGMRRIGKTSLLYKFHDRHRQPRRDAPLTVYFTLAERRAPMMDPNQSVSSVFFASIAQSLGKRHFSSTDLNRELGDKLRQTLGSEKDSVRNAIMELRDPESLADSLTVLSERLLEWAGGASRVIYLVDEAETLVLPYRGSEAKRLELQQLMQGLREVSQTSTKVGLLLSGSNHIAEFARSYKNAFFGSSLKIDLAGMTDLDTAKNLVSPAKLKPYIAFLGDPVRYAIDMCAGMPQFLWHLGAATAAIVRSGPVTKADVRHGVSALIGVKQIDLPFTAYDVLEPIEHMLGLQGQREQDLLWLALWRVANSSSLVANEAQLSYIIDQSLIELDEFDAWKARLLSLVDLEILELSKSSMFRFRVPIFAEGFRAPRREHDYHLRHQRAAT